MRCRRVMSEYFMSSKLPTVSKGDRTEVAGEVAFSIMNFQMGSELEISKQSRKLLQKFKIYVQLHDIFSKLYLHNLSPDRKIDLHTQQPNSPSPSWCVLRCVSNKIFSEYTFPHESHLWIKSFGWCFLSCCRRCVDAEVVNAHPVMTHFFSLKSFPSPWIFSKCSWSFPSSPGKKGYSHILHFNVLPVPSNFLCNVTCRLSTTLETNAFLQRSHLHFFLRVGSPSCLVMIWLDIVPALRHV